MSNEMHPEVKPLTKKEQAWIERLEKVLLSCPSDRLGLITIGDPRLTIFDDKVARRHDLDLHDGWAERNGLVLGSVNSKPVIHGVSG